MSENPASDRAELLAALQAMQARLEAAEQARSRAELLAEASAVLSESLDHKVVLDRLARLVARSFATWCVIDLVEDHQILRVAGVHSDPEKQALLDELRQRYPPDWDSPQPAVEVLKTGAPRFFTELSDEQVHSMTRDQEHFRLIKALGARSGMTVPLVARGRTLGSITAGSEQASRRFGEPDLALIGEIARQAAIAIENAQLYYQCQEAVRLRDEFLSVASHELNTPMAALMLSLEGLGTPDPDLQLDAKGMVQVAKLAERQGKRLTKLIGDLLDITRLSRGAMPLHCEEVDLLALVREVVARYKPELERAGCAVSIDAPGPVVGRWDPMRLDQVVLNLLANAVKFGPKKPVAIRLERAGGQARLSVTDQGIGLDPGQRHRIFERFERAVSHHYGGLGLGLYISRRIVESHGGSIDVESRPGHGARFTVVLPCDGPVEAAV